MWGLPHLGLWPEPGDPKAPMGPSLWELWWGWSVSGFWAWAVHIDGSASRHSRLAMVLLSEGMGGGDPQGLYLLLGAELRRLALFSSQSSRWPSGSSVMSSGHSLARLSSVGIGGQSQMRGTLTPPDPFPSTKQPEPPWAGVGRAQGGRPGACCHLPRPAPLGRTQFPCQIETEHWLPPELFGVVHRIMHVETLVLIGVQT